MVNSRWQKPSTCPCPPFLGLHLSPSRLVHDSLAHCCSPIQRTKKWELRQYKNVTKLCKRPHPALPLPAVLESPQLLVNLQLLRSQLFNLGDREMVAWFLRIVFNWPVWGGKGDTLAEHLRSQLHPSSQQRWTARSPPGKTASVKINNSVVGVTWLKILPVKFKSISSLVGGRMVMVRCPLRS